MEYYYHIVFKQPSHRTRTTGDSRAQVPERNPGTNQAPQCIVNRNDLSTHTNGFSPFCRGFSPFCRPLHSATTRLITPHTALTSSGVQHATHAARTKCTHSTYSSKLLPCLVSPRSPHAASRRKVFRAAEVATPAHTARKLYFVNALYSILADIVDIFCRS